MSKAKAKGTAAETALVNWLREHGFPGAERRALGGGGFGEDLGDITGTPCLAWEVKNHKSYKFPEWLQETKIETENAKADFGILVVKPNGVGLSRPGDWWAMMKVEDIVNLLREAGYGYEGDPEEVIVDLWFKDLCRGMFAEEGLDDTRGAGYINVVPITRDKSEVS